MQIDADAVTRLRTHYPLSRSELAERVGITKHAIRLIEIGVTRTPKPRTIRELARVLEVTVEDITCSAGLPS